MARTDSALITRRQAIASLATLATGTLLRPTSVFGIEPPGSKTRFAVLGDFGTGESDEYAVAAQMLESHQKAGFEFVLAVGDNIRSEEHTSELQLRGHLVCRLLLE